MSIQLLKAQDQNTGAFDNGKIKERKPVAFPSENPVLHPFSTLFYWAYAWSHHGGLIGEHPHRGFEICTFVLEGSIEHYDSNNQKWLPLKAGDVQIIRSGSGITHAEKLNPGSRIFQIWFDPDLQQSLGKPASYDDYRDGDFPIAEKNGLKITTFIGPGGPIIMDTPIRARRFEFSQGEHIAELAPEHKAGLFLFDGELTLLGTPMQKGDFALIEQEQNLTINASTDAVLFAIEVLDPAPYQTYAASR